MLTEHIVGTISSVTPAKSGAIVRFHQSFAGLQHGIIRSDTVGRSHLMTLLGGQLRQGAVVLCAKDTLRRGSDGYFIGELVFFDPDSEDGRFGHVSMARQLEARLDHNHGPLGSAEN